MRFVVLLSSLLLLASCSNYSNEVQKEIPQKKFQYTFQEPTRDLLSSQFSNALNQNKQKSTINVKLSKYKSATIKTGRSYFSASGHDCRKYTLQSGQQASACKIDGRWYNASPILLEK